MIAGFHNLWQPGSPAARKWREIEKMKRKWRWNEEMERWIGCEANVSGRTALIPALGLEMKELSFPPNPTGMPP